MALDGLEALVGNDVLHAASIRFGGFLSIASAQGGIPMEDYSAMIRRTFQQGSVLDAEALFEAFLRNAFPTFHFRRTEVISFTRGETEAMEGRS